MLIKILIGLVILIVVLVIIVATRPSTFRVQRAITIGAPAENVFDRINDFRNWGTWSPWEKKDPDMKRTFGDQTAGVGGTYAWAGDRNVGEGRMTIERSERPSLVQIKLEFFKPFAGTNTATFTLAPATGGTTVTWSMDGRYNFVSKAFSMVMDMDKMIGNDFEAGLAAIKTQAEADAKAGTTSTTASAH
jgi:hypothetical protein